MVGVGGAPLVSIRMGEGNLQEAKRVLSNCFLMLVVFSVLLIGGILPFREPMLRLFGASDATYSYAEEYFTAYLCGTFFALAASGLNQFVICQGFAKMGMASVMLGAALNIALDPLFIFVFDMGVRGAAIATVISQAASAAFVVAFLFGKRVMVAHHLWGLRPAGDGPGAGDGLHAVPHCGGGQRDDHCHERHLAAHRRR